MPRKMKESDSQLLGLLPSNWECNVVRRYYNIILGKMLCPEKLDESYSLEKYYCAANVHFDGVSDNGLKAMWFSLSEKREYGVREGDLLVVEGGAGAGGAAIAGRQRGFVGVQNSVMIVRPKKDADVRLLKYWLQVAVPSGYIDCVCNRATIPHFTKDKIGNMKIPYPPSAEQRRIAAYLDERCAKIDGMIAEAKASIEDYKKWKQSLIEKVTLKGVGSAPLAAVSSDWVEQVPAHWRFMQIRYLFELRDERTEKPLSEVNLISLYTDKGVVQHCDLEKTTGNKAATADGYKLVYEDDIVVNIILCWMGAIGRSAYAGVTSPAYDVYRVKRQGEVLPRYYHYLFRTTAFSGACYRRGRGIMMMRWRTYSDEFRSIKVPVPSYAEQEQIANYLDEKCAAIDKLVGEKEALIADLEAYKKSLIFETVTGKREVA